nr:hypothetical protein [uncultured bacterium]
MPGRQNIAQGAKGNGHDLRLDGQHDDLGFTRGSSDVGRSLHAELSRDFLQSLDVGIEDDNIFGRINMGFEQTTQKGFAHRARAEKGNFHNVESKVLGRCINKCI